ncbi:MAG: hypothetical protein PHO20_06220 [Candidatus Peribacteraceae bacterium]|nr:hypothetical protein [Candidatus Peribacteraceae bacterium]MDD5740332.1 hypothetical protein [Candidatus Peribacteraceae bacterium]
MIKKPARITLAIVLDHIQAMRGDFATRMDRMEQRMDRMESRMDRMEGNIDHLKENMRRMDRKVDLISTQVTNIDARLDDLEVVQVPKLKKAVSMR